MSTGANDMLLEVRGLEIQYGAAIAVRGVDLVVRRGEFVSVIGNNGAGKEFEATQWLFLSTWPNPKLDTEVTSMDFASTMNTRCAPFCVAITAEQP